MRYRSGVLSVFLSVVLVVGLCPGLAFAGEGDKGRPADSAVLLGANSIATQSNDIVKMEYALAGTITVEGMEYDDDGYVRRYSYDSLPGDGDVMTLTYADGTTESLVYDSATESFYGEDRSTPSTYSISDETVNADGTGWTKGNIKELTLTLTVDGIGYWDDSVYCTVPVQVIESPVASLAYTPVNGYVPVVFDEESCKSMIEGGWSVSLNPSFTEGDALTVTGVDGTVTRYTYQWVESTDDYGFYSSEGEELDQSYQEVWWVCASYDSSGLHIGRGNGATEELAVLYYWYCECKVPFKVVDSYGNILDVTWVEEDGEDEDDLIPLDSATLALSETSYAYDGNAKAPDVTVKASGTTLVRDADYTVSYTNNINAGTATATVTGIGAYTGTLTANFTINAAPLCAAKLTLRSASGAYTGTAQSGAVASVVLNGRTLASGTDYTVAAESGTAVGKYLVTVNGTGNYNDKVTAYYEVTPTPITGATVTLNKASGAYTGRAQTATITGVKLGNVALASGTDYTVTAAKTSKANVGSYDIVVTGKGNYTGTAKTTYSITKAANPMKLKATSKTLKANKKTKKLASKKTFTIAFSKKAQGKVTYTVAKAAKKHVSVTKAGKVTVKKGTPKGTYKITVKAAGNANYSASAAKTYKVVVK